MNRRKSILFCIVLLACAGVLTRWIDMQRADSAAGFTPLRASLSEIPKRLGPWEFTQDLPLESEVLRTANVDDFVHRGYLDSTSGRRVVLYVGYWGRENVGTGHGPDVCYPAIGWTAESDPTEQTLQSADSAEPNGARVALHRFTRWNPYEIEKLSVAFAAVVDGEVRASSLGSFSHRPRRLYECGGPFLAHVQVARSVTNNEWNAAEEDVLSFLELLLPALNACLPQTQCSEPPRDARGIRTQASAATSAATLPPSPAP